MNPKDANGSNYFLVLPNFIDRRRQLIQVQVQSMSTLKPHPWLGKDKRRGSE